MVGLQGVHTDQRCQVHRKRFHPPSNRLFVTEREREHEEIERERAGVCVRVCVCL